MRFTNFLGTLFLALSVTATFNRAFAVEAGGVKIDGRWSVVGIISGGSTSTTGIAVLRNNSTKRTYTLSIGDALPNEFGFVLKSIKNRQVEVASESETVALAFSEGSSEEAEKPTQTEKFIDNFYKSLGERSATDGNREATWDAYRSYDDNNNAAEESESATVPASRYDYQRSGRKRYEVYRSEKDESGQPASGWSESGEGNGESVDSEQKQGDGEQQIAKPSYIPAEVEEYAE